MADGVVLVAVENLGGGGAERVALDLVRHWPAEAGQAVLLVASCAGEYRRQLPPDFPILEVGIPSSPRATVSFLRRLRVLTRSMRVRGVISHMTGMNRMMLRAKACGVIRTKVIAVEHNDFLRENAIAAMNPLRAMMLLAETRLLYRSADAVVGCSAGVTAQIGRVFGIPSGKLHAIVNPVDARFSTPRALDPVQEAWFGTLNRPIVVSVGRLVPQKAFTDLVAAFAQVDKGTLVIFGEGPQRADLERQIADLGMEGRVLLPGFQDAPERFLQAADLYASSSLWEGYPLTLLEAYSAGLPVVARNCDFGPAEIVPGRPGQLVPRAERGAGDAAAIAELAAAIRDSLTRHKRFAPGTVVDLRENQPDSVARRYRDVLAVA